MSSALVDPRDLVGQKEAIAITGLSKQRFQVLVREQRIPAPVVVLACGPIWTTAQIEEWTAEHRASTRP